MNDRYSKFQLSVFITGLTIGGIRLSFGPISDIKSDASALLLI